MLKEEDRSQLARYEAFLALSSEMIALSNVAQVAQLLVSRLKYITNVYAWRYLSLGPDETRRAVNPSADLNACSDVFIIDGARGEVHVTSGPHVPLTQFERDAWTEGKASFLGGDALAASQDDLPRIFQQEDIAQIYVYPQWGKDRLEALFFTSIRDATFDKFDVKFIALTSSFFHRKIDYLRMEKRMTDELLDTLNRLRLTQGDLVQSEKLAALGSMVAGVSHELNTPIANAMMMSSTLIDHLKSLDTMMQSGGMRKSDLLRWQGGAIEMGQLLDRSIQRAATLITSFKQVAVDQTSERRRSFDLKVAVEDMLAALRPGLKGTPWTLENEIPDGIECDTYPGPLGQIITNLVQNAVLHGFEGRTQGRVALAAQLHNGQVTLTVTDDGVGMDSSVLMHIFEPFFTTKLGKGGSGLGLAISYRIATTILAGDLRALSSPGTGTRFTLTMPQRTPGKL